MYLKMKWLYYNSLKCKGVASPHELCDVQRPHNEREQAIGWLGSLPEVTAISRRLLPDSGVIVVEVKQALRSQDFRRSGSYSLHSNTPPMHRGSKLTKADRQLVWPGHSVGREPAKAS